MKNTTPLYLVKPDDPVIAAWADNIDLLSKRESTHISIDISPGVIENADVQMMQEMVLVMQHHPQIIEKFLFTVVFKFPEIEDSELYFPEEAWKNNPAVQRWFLKLNSLPSTIFFINDSECRMLCLAGDMVADNKVHTVTRKASGSSFLQFSAEQMQTLADRLFTSCWFMMLYCHNTGFDPSEYIQTLMAEFDLPFSFEDVKEKYEEDLEKGIQLRAQPQQNK